MKTNEIFARLKHVKHRPADAFRRLRRRFILRIGGIDLSKQTELQYIEIGNFDSKILILFDSKVHRALNFELNLLIIEAIKCVII